MAKQTLYVAGIPELESRLPAELPSQTGNPPALPVFPTQEPAGLLHIPDIPTLPDLPSGVFDNTNPAPDLSNHPDTPLTTLGFAPIVVLVVALVLVAWPRPDGL